MRDASIREFKTRYVEDLAACSAPPRSSPDTLNKVAVNRIAQAIADDQRILTGRPSCDLRQLLPAEREQYLALARRVLRIRLDLEGWTEPATLGEVARVEREDRLLQLQIDLRDAADRLDHSMGTWQWLRQAGGVWFLRSECRHCHAAMEINTQTQAVSREPKVLLECASVREELTVRR